MAATVRPGNAGAVGQALVDFSCNGLFPEEDVSSLHVGPEELQPAIQALVKAKSVLEADIHRINKETAGDVSAWMSNAKSVQDDIIRSKNLANDIIRQSEEPDVSGKTIREAEEKADFLIRELNYNQQVIQALKAIKGMNKVLDQVEQARNERRILDALHLLERSWAELDAIPASKSCRVMRLLDIRAFELKSNVHDVFDHVWNALVHVDAANGRISVSETRQDEPMSLSDAIIGLKAYKEVDQRMSQLWHDIDKAIVGPRTNLEGPSLPSIRSEGDMLETTGQADQGIKSLFADLDQIFTFFAKKLPADLVSAMSTVMMPDLISRVIGTWLDPAVPSSLREMDAFQEVISAAKGFCCRLPDLGFSGFDDLQQWVDDAPKVWLAKCRETALDTVRAKLSQGLGDAKEVERVETRMVSRAEGKELTENTAATTVDNQDWDTAWSGQEDEATRQEFAKAPDVPQGDDDGTDAWGWGEDEETTEASEPDAARPDAEKHDDEDDAAEAWGWGEEDDKPQAEAAPTKAPRQAAPARTEPETREMTMKETYNISSLPESVLALIFTILKDGASLTQGGSESSPVAAAAAGLFSLPTLALAMFRAVSPYYYALDIGGNMFLYNDATYLSEKLADFAASWKKREDLSTRAQNMLRIDNDVKALQSFANRAYSNEMTLQKTVLRDILGGEQNLLHQAELDSCIDSAVSRVRSMAVTWETILARSAWHQAVGSIVDAVSTKIISDVMDMSSIGQDEAYNVAKLIATVTELDDLFLPSRAAAEKARPEPDDVPTTAQYTPSWLRLKYLSEVLQSNLNDVRYLWMESELSLYFNADEVVDLIKMSFEDNARTREVVKEVTQNPDPQHTGGAQEAWSS